MLSVFLLDKSFIFFLAIKCFVKDIITLLSLRICFVLYCNESQFMAKLQMTLSKDLLIDLYFVFNSNCRYLEDISTINKPLNALTVVIQMYHNILNVA